LQSSKEAVVTPEQVETEVMTLREQVLHLQQRQEEQKKQWLWWSRIGAGIGLALLAADAFGHGAFSSPFHYGGPPTTFFVMAFLAVAFGSVAQAPATGMHTHRRNFALWVIIVLLLLAVFTLFQFEAWI
jgi:hypothetical protein